MGDFSGAGLVSQVFHGSTAAYRSLGAADFSVPDGQTWTITTVVAKGRYHEVGGRHANVLVSFYADGQDLPGLRLAHAVVFEPRGPYFDLPLRRDAVTLGPGHYWVSVQVLGRSGPFWTWSTQTEVAGDRSVWRNPSDVFDTSCVTWTPLDECSYPEGPDFMFRLLGTASS